MRLFLSAALGLLPLIAVAGTPVVFDINTRVQPLGSTPDPLGAIGSTWYFGAMADSTNGHGALYRSDGTAAGTVRVKTFDGPGPRLHSLDRRFIGTAAKGYFIADETATGRELWVTDGTEAGTHLVADLFPGASASVQLLGLLGTDLIFAAATSSTNWQIFRTDGTSAGTQAITSFAPSSYGEVNEALITGGKIYVIVSPTAVSANYDLWVSNGSPGGATLLTLPMSFQPALDLSSLQVLGNAVLFLSTTQDLGTEIGRVDISTDAVTYLDTAPGPSPGVQFDTSLRVIGGFAYFVGGCCDRELWRTDGTPAGTTQAVDIVPGPDSAFPSQSTKLIQVGDRLVFQAIDPQNGEQLWGSDGTPQGTARLTSAEPGFHPIRHLGTIGSHAYYAVHATGPNFDVIVTNGTVAGTRVLTGVGQLHENFIFTWVRVEGGGTLAFLSTYRLDANQNLTQHLFSYDAQGNTLVDLSAIVLQAQFQMRNFFAGGQLLLAGDDGETGLEPWLSDGTVAGTRLLSNVAAELASDDSSPDWLTELDGKLMFAADDGIHGIELWQSDGTPAGTRLAFDIVPGLDSSSPRHLFAWNGALYFSAGFVPFNPRFMRMTAAGVLETLAQVTLHPVLGDSDFVHSSCTQARPVVLGNRLYFAANDNLNGLELWSTDGTAAGTTLLKDINPGPGWSSPCSFVVFGDRIYFRATDITGGAALWSTDGTAAGTTKFNGGNGPLRNGFPRFVHNNELYFVALRDDDAFDTWKTNGTASGTRLLMDAGAPAMPLSPFATMNGKLMLSDTFLEFGVFWMNIWVSDGTAAGTSKLPGVRIPADTSPVRVVRDRLYFSNADSVDVEPWISDGTAAGTRALADLNSSGSSNPRWIADFHGVAFIQASDNVRGPRIWRSNGTAAGTVPVGDAAPYTIATGRNAPVTAGQNLFYVGDDPVAGYELSVLPNDAPVATNDTATSANGAAITINVAANDSDPDGAIDAASVRVATAPANGTATVGTNGSITYTPRANFAGSDSFTYSVADNQGHTRTATVSLTVTQASPPPPPPSGGGGGGGGGAMGIWALLMLAGMLRTRERLRFRSP